MVLQAPISLKASNLHISYGQTPAIAIEKLDVAGNIIGLIGHNGSGKSTIIKSTLQLVKPVSGWIQALNNSQQLIPHESMAFSPEKGSVFADITVEDYVRLWCRIKRKNVKYYLKEGLEITEELGITKLYSKLGRELSKGEKRLVQTAIGLLLDPKLFLLDEPFDGLDVARTQEFSTLIRNQSTKRSFLISSHRMNIMERLADTLIVLNNGKVCTVGNPEEVSKFLSGKQISLLFESRLKPDEQAKLMKSFKAFYQEHIITSIGKQISISGPLLKEQGVQEFANQLGAKNFKIETTVPTLTDAMAYHLKNARLNK